MGKIVTLPIRIDPGRGHTLQQQLYSGIRASIVTGRFGAEGRLPSTRALAAELGISRTTVLLAFEQLRAEGYIVPRPGSGNYIARLSPEQVGGSDSRRAAPTLKHPGLSARGRTLAASRTPDRRGSAPPRAFRLGTPAVDLFPFALWSQLARQCLGSVSRSRLDYSRLAGLTELREAIAEQVAARGTSCELEQVFIVAGAQRGLDLVFHLLLDPGDLACIEDPGYPGAHSALLSAGARALSVPVDRDGFSVDRARSGARLAYVTPSHQFPLGVAMSLERRRALLEWAADNGAWVVEDDYDCAFRYDARPLPCLHALDPDGRVIYVGTFSKTLFPSLRIGFLIVPTDLVDAFARARLASDVHPPLLEQSVLAAFMLRGHYQRHLRRMQTAYTERLDTLRSALARSGAPLRLRPVHSGLHAVVDLEAGDAEHVARAAAEHHLEIMPLGAYHYGAGTCPDALVLGFGAVRPTVISSGVSRLARVIEAAGATPFT
jgi:GntR family transcriptional regulator / MocR family aminotransferase